MVERTGGGTLGDLIRERRQAKGWTRRDLAEETGLSYPYVSQLETAHRLPSSRAMQSLARALEIDASELFEALPEDPSPPLSLSPEPARSAVKPGGAAAARAASRARSDASPSSAPADRDRWIANPARRGDPHAGVVPRAAPPVGLGRDEAVRRAVDALESLDEPDERLAALHEVQSAVVAGIVRDERRR